MTRPALSAQSGVAVRMRVHELARELGVDSRAILTRLAELGEYVKSASSLIEAPTVRRVRETFPRPAVADRVVQSGVSASPATYPAASRENISSSPQPSTDGDWFRRLTEQASNSAPRSGRWTKVDQLSPIARALLPDYWRARSAVPADVVANVNEQSRDWAVLGFTAGNVRAWRDLHLRPETACYLASREVDPLILTDVIRPKVSHDSQLTWLDALYRGFLGSVPEVCGHLARAGYHVAAEPTHDRIELSVNPPVASATASPPVSLTVFSDSDSDSGGGDGPAPATATQPTAGARRAARRPGRPRRGT